MHKERIKENLLFSAALFLTSVFGTLYARFQIHNSLEIVSSLQKFVTYCFCFLSLTASTIFLGCAIWEFVRYKQQKHRDTPPIVLGRPGSGKARGFIKVETIDVEEEEEE